MRQAVEATFPGFGYAPEEIARFLGLNAEPYDDAHYVLREGDQTLAVLMRCGDLLEYVVSATWDGRYEAVARAVGALKTIHPTLHVHIREDLPSHASWFAALLPALGFEMIPRVRMVAPLDSLRNIQGEQSVSPYRLVAMEPRWQDRCVAVHLNAHRLPSAQAEEMAENLRDSQERPDRLDSWTVALHGDDLVGSCFGSHHRGRLFVEELAVSEDHRNRSLGRALLLRSVEKLIRAFQEAETAVLDVDRTNVPAVRLYTALGFAPQERYTVARS